MESVEVFDLDKYAEEAYVLCRARGKDSDEPLDFLKYAAGELAEACHAYAGWERAAASKTRLDAFALEMADVITTLLILMEKAGVSPSRALSACHAKNEWKRDLEDAGVDILPGAWCHKGGKKK